VVFSLFASYIVAMTVVPLYCARFIKPSAAHASEGQEIAEERHTEFRRPSVSFIFQRIVRDFNDRFQRMLEQYVLVVNRSILRPVATTLSILGMVLLSFALFPFLGRSYFPRTDPGQFVINIKCPSGTRIELSNQYIAQVEREIRQVISAKDLDMIVSNIGITPDLSAIYTSNSSMDTAFVQVSLKEGHKLGSYEYMRRVRRKLADDMPMLSTYFQAGGLVDSVINQGLPAPIDIQVSGNDLTQSFAIASQIAAKAKMLKNVSDVLIPQNLRYPGLELNIDRQRASLIGLSPKEVVDNVITALTSNGMIAPSYWIDPNTGNNYMLTVQYFDKKIGHMSMDDFKQIPLRAINQTDYTPLRSVADIKEINTPTEVDHYKIRRVIDVYVMPSTEALQGVTREVNDVIDGIKTPSNVRVTVRGSVVSMNESFKRFAIGLVLSILLVYLILMAQFTSFVDPFIILMAIPPGLSGVLFILLLTHSTMNIMSLMGVIMMTGIVVSNSILIVEFAGHLHEGGLPVAEAVVQSCKIRLRPILMTSLATLLGMIPMALGLEVGSEQYAPLARAIIGGLGVSVIVTVFLVPAVYLIIHGRREEKSVAGKEV
jgi:multidrug efflux pump subunit AcrB